MADDTNWLKKNPVANPFKLNLKRSSRFYAQDMDGTITTHENKSKNQILVVPHIPRKSNIPMEVIKQMDFKIPGPVLKKSSVKRPITRMSKFPLNPSSKPNNNFRSQNQNLRKSSVRSRETGSSLFNLSIASTTMTERKMPENSSLTSKQNTEDLSIISWSDIISQSTPKDEAALRSILKIKEFTENSCTSSFSENKKPKAAKKVNFNCVSRESEHTNENHLKTNNSFISVCSQASHSPELLNSEERIQKEKELLNDTGEDSTVAFTCSFKPIVYDEKDEKAVADKVEKFDVKTDGKEGKNSDSDIIISRIIEMWSVYRRNFNEIWSQLQSNDEEFKSILKSVEENDFQNKFSTYEKKKYELYEKLKVLEMEFKEKINNKVDMKKFFGNYIERKADIHREIRELDVNFEKMLHKVTNKYLGEELNEGKENEDVPEKKCSARGKKKSDGGKVSQASAIPRRCNLKRTSNRGSTPENNTNRRKLSRKIEKQIRILFEE